MEESIISYQSFDDFWPFYVREHSKPLTRALHFCGTGLMLVIVAASILINGWIIVLAPVAGYGFAWAAHFLVEKNQPATFRYPLWSLIADLKMFCLMCLGKMKFEVRAYIWEEP